MHTLYCATWVSIYSEDIMLLVILVSKQDCTVSAFQQVTVGKKQFHVTVVAKILVDSPLDLLTRGPRVLIYIYMKTCV